MGSGKTKNNLYRTIYPYLSFRGERNLSGDENDGGELTAVELSGERAGQTTAGGDRWGSYQGTPAAEAETRRGAADRGNLSGEAAGAEGFGDAGDFAGRDGVGAENAAGRPGETELNLPARNLYSQSDDSPVFHPQHGLIERQAGLEGGQQRAEDFGRPAETGGLENLRRPGEAGQTGGGFDRADDKMMPAGGRRGASTAKDLNTETAGDAAIGAPVLPGGPARATRAAQPETRRPQPRRGRRYHPAGSRSEAPVITELPEAGGVDQSLADAGQVEDEIMLELVPAVRRPMTTPEMARYALGGQAAAVLAPKYDLPDSDIRAFYEEKGFTDYKTKTPIPDEGLYAGGGIDRQKLSVTGRDIDELRNYSQGRRRRLTGEALQFIASGAPLTPQRAQQFADDEIDLNRLMTPNYSATDPDGAALYQKAAMAQTMGEAKRRDLSVYETEERRRDGNAYLAHLRAMRRVGWLNDAGLHEGEAKYREFREQIRQLMAGERESATAMSNVTGLGDVPAGRGYEAVRPVTEAEIDARLDELRGYQLSGNEQQRSAEVADFYNKVLGNTGSSALSAFLAAGGGTLRTAAGILRLFSAGGQAQKLSRLGSQYELSAEKMGDGGTWSETVKLGGTALELPRLGLAIEAAGPAGGFAVLGAVDTYGAGKSLGDAATGGVDGAAQGLLFGGASRLGNLAGKKVFSGFLSEETKAALANPALRREYAEAVQAGESPILNPEVKKALIYGKVIGETTRLGSIYAGTTGINLAGGQSTTDALKNAAKMTLIDFVAHHAETAGQTFRQAVDGVKGKILNVVVRDGRTVPVMVNADGEVEAFSRVKAEVVDNTIVSPDTVERAKNITPNRESVGTDSQVTKANNNAPSRTEKIAPATNDVKRSQIRSGDLQALENRNLPVPNTGNDSHPADDVQTALSPQMIDGLSAPQKSLAAQNPIRIEYADPNMVAKVKTDKIALQITDVLEKSDRPVSHQEIQSMTGLSEPRTIEALLDLYGARQIEILPDNTVRKIGASAAAEPPSRTLLERVAERQQSLPVSKQAGDKEQIQLNSGSIVSPADSNYQQSSYYYSGAIRKPLESSQESVQVNFPVQQNTFAERPNIAQNLNEFAANQPTYGPLIKVNRQVPDNFQTQENPSIESNTITKPTNFTILPKFNEIPENTASLNRTVMIGNREVVLTPEQAILWKHEVETPLAKAQERFVKNTHRDPALLQKHLRQYYETIKQIRAKKREITNLQRLAEKARNERNETKYLGKSIFVNGQKGRVVGGSNGRIKIRFDNYTERVVKKEDLQIYDAKKNRNNSNFILEATGINDFGSEGLMFSKHSDLIEELKNLKFERLKNGNYGIFRQDGSLYEEFSSIAELKEKLMQIRDLLSEQILASDLHDELMNIRAAELPIKVLIPKIKLETEDGVAYLNAHATELVRRVLKESDFLGVYMPPFKTKKFLSDLDNFFATQELSLKSYKILREFVYTLFETAAGNDLILVPSNLSLPRGEKQTIQEEKAHRLDYRHGVRFTVSSRIFIDDAIGSRAMLMVSMNGYEGVSENTLSAEVAAKIWVDDNESLGITSEERKYLQNLLYESWIKAGANQEIILFELEKISKTGKAYAEEQRKKNAEENQRRAEHKRGPPQE